MNGQGLISAIDERDEMFAVLSQVLKQHFPELSEADLRAQYISHGERLFSDMTGALRQVGRSVEQTGSLLDFACGYGRVTRHWVHKLGPDKVTASDIDRDAVDFVRRTFGVKGFYSVSDPDQLRHDEKYEVIHVISLFTHLPLSSWATWLKRLCAMLEPNGILLFTTSGADLYASHDDDQKQQFEQPAEGFYYWGYNETSGRLPGTEYGGTYVSEAFVRGVVATHGLGKLLGYYPKKLDDHQDIYVLEKPGS